MYFTSLALVWPTQNCVCSLVSCKPADKPVSLVCSEVRGPNSPRHMSSCRQLQSIIHLNDPAATVTTSVPDDGAAMTTIVASNCRATYRSVRKKNRRKMLKEAVIRHLSDPSSFNSVQFNSIYLFIKHLSYKKVTQSALHENNFDTLKTGLHTLKWLT